MQRLRSDTANGAPGHMKAPQAGHRRTISRSARAPSKNGALGSSGMGTGLLSVIDTGLLCGLGGEDGGGVEVEGAAVAADQDVVVGLLALAGLAAGLDDRF